MIDTANLPDDVSVLKAIILAQSEQNARLEGLVAAFRQAMFGARSEKINPDRLAARQERSAPRIKTFEQWLREHRAKVSRKSPLGEALKYIAKYWDGLCLFLTDGRIEMDNNAVERTIRPIALNRKNALFAGHDAGAENWAVMASLIETCKLNNIEPHAYLTDILRAIVSGHKQSQIEQLLPWNYNVTV